MASFHSWEYGSSYDDDGGRAEEIEMWEGLDDGVGRGWESGISHKGFRLSTCCAEPTPGSVTESALVMRLKASSSAASVSVSVVAPAMMPARFAPSACSTGSIRLSSMPGGHRRRPRRLYWR